MPPERLKQPAEKAAQAAGSHAHGKDSHRDVVAAADIQYEHERATQDDTDATSKLAKRRQANRQAQAKYRVRQLVCTHIVGTSVLQNT